MNDLIVNGLFSLAAAIITGLVAILAARSAAGIERLRAEQANLRRQAEQLLQQVEAYHLLEDLYAQEIAGSRQYTSARKVKTEFRDRVVERHQCVRPNMTSNEARRRLQDAT